jgi:septum formation protein
MGFHLYLASASPRRRELLAQVGLRYRLVAAEIPEEHHPEEAPEVYVLRIALEKARAGRLQAGSDRRPVLGADTAVVLEGEVLGKPRDRSDALFMLARLSGRSHHVLTAVAMVSEGEERSLLSSSIVHFRTTTPEERAAYVATGEPLDKAGAYGIQGKAAIFIERLEGSYSGVMGLPLFETAELLKSFGVPAPSAWGGKGTE